MTFRAALFLLTAASLLAACGARSSLQAAAGSAGGAGAGGSTSGTGAGGSATGTGGSPGCIPSLEICDGLDNDCNGLVDETCPGCIVGLQVTCYAGLPETRGVGVCKDGIQTCGPDAVWGPCVGDVLPSAELCGNGLDEDCNGLVDEACVNGCSDGTREGFLDTQKFPKIAACSGGWALPGVLSTLGPTCGRNAGNSSQNPLGNGCTVADLCSSGFHVCTGPAEVDARSPSGCDEAAPSPGLFFAVRQSSDGCGVCAVGMNVDPVVCTGCGCNGSCAQTAQIANDLFGCGSLGLPPSAGCGPLDRFSDDGCGALGPPWVCSGDSCNEANNVIKVGSDGGGVLCCAD